MSRRADVPTLVGRAREGDPRSVARLISLVEDGDPALPEVAAALAPYAGHAQVVGLTGSPGVGKSTTTNELVKSLRTSGRRVGVLAVDPSSPFTGGAILGDRVRMQEHTTIGATILENSDSPMLQLGHSIARHHHERWDGGGYPDGLAGEDIPVAGRLVHLADVFDILVHERPYKEEWAVEDAAEELRRNAGSQFDPDVVAAFDELDAATWKALSADV